MSTQLRRKRFSPNLRLSYKFGEHSYLNKGQIDRDPRFPVFEVEESDTKERYVVKVYKIDKPEAIREPDAHLRSLKAKLTKINKELKINDVNVRVNEIEDFHITKKRHEVLVLSPYITTCSLDDALSGIPNNTSIDPREWLIQVGWIIDVLSKTLSIAESEGFGGIKIDTNMNCHGYLKPQKILLPIDKRDIVIIDYGIESCMHTFFTEPLNTRYRSWVHPEGRYHPSKRSDLYSLAAIACDLLTGDRTKDDLLDKCSGSEVSDQSFLDLLGDLRSKLTIKYHLDTDQSAEIAGVVVGGLMAGSGRNITGQLKQPFSNSAVIQNIEGFGNAFATAIKESTNSAELQDKGYFRDFCDSQRSNTSPMGSTRTIERRLAIVTGIVVLSIIIGALFFYSLTNDLGDISGRLAVLGSSAQGTIDIQVTAIAELEVNLITEEVAVAALSTANTAQSNTITIQQQQIATRDDVIATQEVTLSGLAVEVATQAMAVAALEVQLTTEEATAAALSTTNTAQSNIISTQQKQIAAKDELIATQEVTVSGLAAEVATQATAVAALEVQLATEEATADALSIANTAQSNTITTQQEQIATKDQLIATQEVTAAALSTTNTAQSDTITTQQEQIATKDQLIATQEVTVSGLAAEVATQATAIAALEVQLSTEEATADALSAANTAQSNTITIQQQQIATRDDVIATQEVIANGLTATVAVQVTTIANLQDEGTAQSVTVTSAAATDTAQADIIATQAINIRDQSSTATNQATQITGLEADLAVQQETITAQATQINGLEGAVVTLSQENTSLAVTNVYLHTEVAEQATLIWTLSPSNTPTSIIVQASATPNPWNPLFVVGLSDWKEFLSDNRVTQDGAGTSYRSSNGETNTDIPWATNPDRDVVAYMKNKPTPTTGQDGTTLRTTAFEAAAFCDWKALVTTEEHGNEIRYTGRLPGPGDFTDELQGISGGLWIYGETGTYTFVDPDFMIRSEIDPGLDLLSTEQFEAFNLTLVCVIQPTDG